jgi:branched-chain amino acid transport system substrate-binding protein
MRKPLVRSLLLWAFVVLTVGRCQPTKPEHSTPAQAQAAIKIGVIAPFHTTPGDGIRNGVAMAVDEINAAGGIGGRKLQVIAVDDAFSQDKAVRAYQSLASSHNVVTVIGTAGSGIFPIMEQLSRYEVPMIATGVGADRLTEMVQENPSRYGYFFRIMHRSSEMASVTSDFLSGLLYKKEGLRRFAIVAEDDIWTKYLRDEWRSTIKKLSGASIVYETTFSAETSDFAPIFAQIRAARAEYILDAASRVPASTYLKRWAELKGPMIGAVPTGAGSRKYYDEIGPSGTTVCTIGTIPSPNNPTTARATGWWNQYTKKYGEPEYTSAYSYDAVYVLKQAIERAASTEPAALRAALEKTDVNGVTGRIVFDQAHQAKYGDGYRILNMLQYQVPNDPYGYRVVWPPSRAVAALIRPAWFRNASNERPVASAR